MLAYASSIRGNVTGPLCAAVSLTYCIYCLMFDVVFEPLTAGEQAIFGFQFNEGSFVTRTMKKLFLAYFSLVTLLLNVVGSSLSYRLCILVKRPSKLKLKLKM